MSALQRLAVIEAAAWWLTEDRGGEQLAHALLEAACSASTVTERAYLALIARQRLAWLIGLGAAFIAADPPGGCRRPRLTRQRDPRRASGLDRRRPAVETIESGKAARQVGRGEDR